MTSPKEHYEQNHLPRGASVLSPRLPLFRTPRANESRWQKKWDDREFLARRIFEAVIGFSLTGELSQHLIRYFKKIDEEIGLSHRVLLAQGTQALRKQELVVIYSNRFGISNKGKNTRFAMGGRFILESQIGNKWRGARKAEAECIGIILNTLAGKYQKRGEETALEITDDQIYDVLEAIIEAQKQNILYQQETQVREQAASEIFTQQEVDHLYHWLLFNQLLV